MFIRMFMIYHLQLFIVITTPRTQTLVLGEALPTALPCVRQTHPRYSRFNYHYHQHCHYHYHHDKVLIPCPPNPPKIFRLHSFTITILTIVIIIVIKYYYNAHQKSPFSLSSIIDPTITTMPIEPTVPGYDLQF